MLSGEDKKKMVARLQRIEGQVAGIKRMVEAETYCIEVLHQFSAAQGALASAAQGILSAHLNSCVQQAFLEGDEEERAAKIAELMNIFSKYGSILEK